MDEVPVVYLSFDGEEAKALVKLKLGDKVRAEITGTVQGIDVSRVEKVLRGSLRIEKPKVKLVPDENEFSRMAEEDLE